MCIRDRNKRSNISLDNPDFIIHLHLNNNKAILSLQSSVESLHKRGYRPAIGNAPLKENLASGLINMTQWNGKVPLIDFMCGSGTFLIEAVKQFLGDVSSNLLVNRQSLGLILRPEKILCKVCLGGCLLYTSPSPRDRTRSRMPSSA